jgi:FAD/FMN-containing dehydrogenase
MMHGSFGTLGILSKIKFKLVPAQPYVHLKYEKYKSLADYLAAIERHAKHRDVDFIDGIIHSPTELILSCGRFTDHAPHTTSYDWWRVYYASTRRRAEDYLTTTDYFFRYDHGVTQVHPRSLPARLLLGKVLGSTQLLWLAGKFHRLLPKEKPNVIVDVFLPISRVPAFLSWHAKELGHFPLWVVPYRRVRDYEWIDKHFFDGVDDDMFIDLAIYGMKQPRGRNAYAMIEKALREIGGIKTLISHNFYSEEEFWSTWNRDNYTRAKRLTDPNNVFRDLYEKTVLASRGITIRTSSRGSAV